MHYLLLFFVLNMPSAQSNLAEQQKGHHITFYKIDNRVKVYVNDTVVYNSKVYDGNPDLKLDVDIEKHLKIGFNRLRVELYNGYEENDFKADRNWEIRYEIFNDEESVDYMHELSKDGAEGLAFTYNHEILKK